MIRQIEEDIMKPIKIAEKTKLIIYAKGIEGGLKISLKEMRSILKTTEKIVKDLKRGHYERSQGKLS